MSDGNQDQIKMIAEAMAESMAVKFSEKSRTHALDLTPTEKAVLSVIVAIVIAMLVWMVNTTNDTAKRVAVIESQLGDIRGASGDRFSATEARVLREEVDRRFRRIERVLDME